MTAAAGKEERKRRRLEKKSKAEDIMKTLIKNGTIITAENEYRGDILIEDEKITAIGLDLKEAADKVIDARGKYVMPGGIDQHTHFEALCTTGDKDTAGYETTKAVIVGGTTTIVDYAPQDPGKGLLESAQYRIEHRAKGKSCVDYALHALITEPTEEMYREISQLPQHGISSIKAFMAYKGSPLHVDDGTLLRVMEESKKAGVTVFIHAENAEIIDMLQKKFIAQGKTAPRYHIESRPPLVESEATRRAIYLAEQIDVPIYIVHISCQGALEAVAAAQQNKQRVFGETCTQYLTLTKEALYTDQFDEAAKFVCSPALRDKEDIAAMWKGLKEGSLSAIVSDHCGIDLAEMKQAGRERFTDIPNGAPGAADRIPVIWTEGVMKGKISRQKFVEVCATLPAKINGIYPRKGAIVVGADADIVIFDPDYRGRITWEANPNGVDYNIYQGRELLGRPDTVLLRGEVMVEGGVFVGEAGQGQFIESKAFAGCYEGL